MGNVVGNIRGSSDTNEEPIKLGGGPFNLGDPNDRRLRKTEKQVVIPKMLKEEAEKKCGPELMKCLECAKRAGFLVTFKCKEEEKARAQCIKSWTTNPEFVNEITEKYLYARSYYRRTGKPLIKYKRGPAYYPKHNEEFT